MLISDKYDFTYLSSLLLFYCSKFFTIFIDLKAGSLFDEDVINFLCNFLDADG